MIPASRPAIPSGTAKPISAPAPSPAAPHRSIVATSVRPAPAGGGRDGSVMLLVLVLHAGCSDRRRNQAAPAWSPPSRRNLIRAGDLPATWWRLRGPRVSVVQPARDR